MIDHSQQDWYKDAIVYQLHVKSFFDSNDDGVGDLAGLTAKLDYIQELGVNTVWLLPFYPSPLRDDGYDIADYRNVNPSYGRLGDFRRFVKSAHERGLRVITELVINHTSDQHPWFQRARRSKPGSAAHNFYVWSDTDQKYLGTRIIFLDTESSNWAWDPVAKAYYWHRFYAHQPDLNFDNPRVLREVLSVLRFWLDMGVDGLRLDAVPYLCEREGTINENLPETHDILKKIRAEVDRRYGDRMLLAEANQWPEDTQEYFGRGDECHMAFHFPLMPRIYMAIAQEDRHPVTDIMRQTPEIPEGCQWAIFLRNHDELTLEMVTDQERDYLWNTYASDKRMRLNLGIRRRLAPLMEHDRRKIELMHGLLLSMPGTPVLYYGDEIGMGDNIFLGDRDGVRTPMQWSPDRNAGFSRADPARLFLPPIMDPLYGFMAVNVEAQARDGSSLLNWMRRMVTVRKAHHAFGRGTLRFLYPGNRKILAYLREYEKEAVLCVFNLSRTAQAVELDLSSFKGRVPIELSGRSPFPPIGDLTYLLTLSDYGFHWFLLAEEVEVPHWHEPTPEPMPELETLVVRDGWASLTEGREAEALGSQVLPRYLANQRWFAAKDRRIEEVRLKRLGELPAEGGDGFLLAEVEVSFAGHEQQRYFLPLGTSWGPGAGQQGSPLLPYTLARTRRVAKVGALIDATADEGFARSLVAAMREETTLQSPHGRLVFSATSHLEGRAFEQDAEIRRLSVEQSNTSIRLGDQGMLKVYRRLTPGIQPELEIGRYLTEVGYANTPPLLAALELHTEKGQPMALAVLHGFVWNQGDGWTHAQSYLDRTLEEIALTEGAEPTVSATERHVAFLVGIRTLGLRVGELHRALALPTDDPAFRPEPIGKGDLARWRSEVKRQAQAGFAALRSARKGLDEKARTLADQALALRSHCLELIDTTTAGPISASKTRTHGDLHLGQVLITKNDYMILDFEGEPARSLEERRQKTSPLRDVAGMLRSFDYAAANARMRLEEHLPDHGDRLQREAAAWLRASESAFLEGYQEGAAGSAGLPKNPTAARQLLLLFRLEKALYEIGYEAANRPRWLPIPLGGLIELLQEQPEAEA